MSSCDDGPKASSFPCCALSTVEMVAVLSCSFMILNVKSKLNSPLFIPPVPMAIEKKRNMTSLIEDVRMSTRPVASSSRKPMTPAVSIVATGEASVRFTFATFSMSCMTVPNDDTLRGHGGGD